MSNKCIAVRKIATPLRELTCHMGSHSVTCHPAEVTFPPLPQPKPVLDSATTGDARLSWPLAKKSIFKMNYALQSETDLNTINRTKAQVKMP